MKIAMESLEKVSSDERMIEIHRAREKSKRDLKSKLIYAERQGIEQGIERGARQKAIETAEELLKLGVDIGIISKSTKLSLDELKEIENQLGMKNN